LPKETSNYVPIIIAITIMAKNAKDYGLDDLVPDDPIAYDAIPVHYPTNLPLIADLTQAPLSEIRDLNPALLKSMAPGGYSLKVPKGTGASVTAALDAIPPHSRSSWRVHRVESGETAAGIAKRYGVTAVALSGANTAGIESLQEGDRLTIPVAQPPKEVAVKPVATAKKARKAGSRRAPSQTASATTIRKDTTRVATVQRRTAQTKKNPI
jgi:membrane-bound lytic murein transglycosylase D